MENRYVKIWKIRIWSPIVDIWFLSNKWYQIQYDMDINRSTKMGKYQTWYDKLSIVSKCRDVMHSNNHVQIWFPSDPTIRNNRVVYFWCYKYQFLTIAYILATYDVFSCIRSYSATSNCLLFTNRSYFLQTDGIEVGNRVLYNKVSESD